MKLRVTDADLLVEELGGDLVAFARCAALDAAVFPHPSIPALVGNPGSPPALLIARAASDGAVLGFIAAEAAPPLLAIVGLAVEPERRRAGVGRLLVRAMVSSAFRRGLRPALHVSTANLAAIALYESEGFVVTRKLRRFYRSDRFADHGDAFEMVLLGARD